MNLTATHLNYYHVCKRKLWLFHHQISMEQTSDTVYEGKLIGETTYPQRAERYQEISLSAELNENTLLAKIDFFDPYNKVVHEIKKSDKLEHAHIAQVKFYQYILELNGTMEATGILEYPKLRQTHHLAALTAEDKKEIEGWIEEISVILGQDFCPERVKKSYCKSCSYFDFCFVED